MENIFNTLDMKVGSPCVPRSQVPDIVSTETVHQRWLRQSSLRGNTGTTTKYCTHVEVNEQVYQMQVRFSVVTNEIQLHCWMDLELSRTVNTDKGCCMEEVLGLRLD